MTADQAKAKLIAWALKQVGYVEGSSNYNKYAPLWTQAGGWNVQNQPWCDVFVDVGFIETFGLELASKLTYQPKGGFSAKCSVSAEYYKNNNAWFTTPEVGDQIFFYYDGGINHTGIVVSVGNGLVTTVEGNSSDMVARRSYIIGSAQIAGYGRPKWTIFENQASASVDQGQNESTVDTPVKPTVSYFPYQYNVQINLLKLGSYGPQVKRVQQLLAANGFDPGEITGEFNAATKKALAEFQTAAGIGVDGEFGGQSFNALWNWSKE